MITRQADKGNYALWRGPKDGDQWEQVSAQYNYFIDTGSGSGTVARPLPNTAASAAVKWDAAGGAQKDAAKLAGSLRKLGKNPMMSVVFYPEVCSEVFERPVVTGSSIYGDVNVAEMFKRHGFIDCIPVKDEYMYTAAGATPTVEAFDVYAIHLPDIRVGYSVDLNTEAIYDPVDKLHYLDMQIAFCPLKVPILYDGDSKYYSGVARVTACDANT
jgi:hypothetical protein